MEEHSTGMDQAEQQGQAEQIIHSGESDQAEQKGENSPWRDQAELQSPSKSLSSGARPIPTPINKPGHTDQSQIQSIASRISSPNLTHTHLIPPPRLRAASSGVAQHKPDLPPSQPRLTQAEV